MDRFSACPPFQRSRVRPPRSDATSDPTDRAILGLLEPASEARAEAPPPDGRHGRGTRDIAAAIGLSPRATRMRLARLAARGLIRELGTGPHDPRRRYVTVR